MCGSARYRDPGDRGPAQAARHHARLAGSAICRTRSANGLPRIETPRRPVERKPQQAMRDHLEGCGFDYLCTDSVDQAIAWLKHHGVLRGGFSVQ